MYIKIEFPLLISCIMVYPLNGQQNITPQLFDTHQKQTMFKDYIKKYTGVAVWENKFQKKNRKNIGLQELRRFVNEIDPTDELISLNIDEVPIANPVLLLKNSRREWQPKGKIGQPNRARDIYENKPRLYELMKQVVYQSRDKMVIMQLLRERMKGDSLYKMGFLFAKIDHQCKLLASVAYKAAKYCSKLRQSGRHVRRDLNDAIEAEERVLNHMMEIDLLIDLLEENDRIAVRTLLTSRTDDDLHNWFKEEGVGV